MFSDLKLPLASLNLENWLILDTNFKIYPRDYLHFTVLVFHCCQAEYPGYSGVAVVGFFPFHLSSNRTWVELNVKSAERAFFSTLFFDKWKARSPSLLGRVLGQLSKGFLTDTKENLYCDIQTTFLNHTTLSTDKQRNGRHDQRLQPRRRPQQQHVGCLPRALRGAPAPQAPRPVCVQLRLPRLRRGPPVRQVPKLIARSIPRTIT